MKSIVRTGMLVMCVFMINATHGQTKLSGGIGVLKTFYPPTGNVNLTYEAKAYMGFSFAIRFDVNDKITVGASLGYHINSYENLHGHITEYGMPVLGMFEYRFGNNAFVPYVGGNMGLYRFGAFGNDGTNTAGYFGLSPSAGFDYNISPAFFIHGCMYYHYIMTQGVRISAFEFEAGIGVKF
ncbi:MAG: outer membrane beta-barrel protein [Bacteroidales bacterium]